MEQKIKQVMAAVFGVDENSIGDDASPSTVANWDSLKHMNLILALEEEFDIEFSDEQVLELLSFRQICSAIAGLS